MAYRFSERRVARPPASGGPCRHPAGRTHRAAHRARVPGRPGHRLALCGDTGDFEAYATALNGPTNSDTADLVDAVGSAYGPDVQKAFDGLWRSEGHIPGFVAYTQAIAADDKAKADNALADLCAYARIVGTTLNSVNSNLPAAPWTRRSRCTPPS